VKYIQNTPQKISSQWSIYPQNYLLKARTILHRTKRLYCNVDKTGTGSSLQFYNQQSKVPASLRTFAIIHAVTDVISLGLHTTVLPAAMAGAILNVKR